MAINPTGVVDIASLPGVGSTPPPPGVGAVALDKDGFTYLAGSYSNNLSVYPLLSVTNGDQYITKLDGNGQALWAVNIGGIDFDGKASPESGITIKTMAVGLDGSVFIGGSLNSFSVPRVDPPVTTRVNDDRGPGLNNKGDQGLGFVMKFDRDGNFLFRLLFDSTGGSGNASIESIKVDQKGRIYYAGTYSLTTGTNSGIDVYDSHLSSGSLSENDFDGSYDFGTSTSGVFVARDISTGNSLNWLVAADANSSSRPEIAVDSSGDVHVAAYLSQEAKIGDTTLSPTSGSSLIYAATLRGSNGKIIAAKPVAQANSVQTSDLTIDAANNLYLVGSFSQSAFSPSASPAQPLPNPGSKGAVFVTKINSAGDLVWLDGIQSTGSVFVPTIGTNGQDQLFLAGSFAGTISIGQAKLDSSPSTASDLFLAQIDTDGRVVTALRGGGTGPDNGGAMAALPSGRIAMAGTIAVSTTAPNLFGRELTKGPRAVVATLQFSRPSAVIAPLPPEVHELAIPVAWGDTSSADATTFDVYVTDNGGPPQLWLPRTGDKSGFYPGAEGHRYTFAAFAYDASGIQSLASAEVATTVRTVAGTSTAIQASAAQILAGQGVSFAATVASADAGWAGPPTGSIQFFLNGQPLGGPVPLDGNGLASTGPITTLPVGGHQITASYIASGRFLASSSGPVAVAVESPVIVEPPPPPPPPPVPTVSVQRAATLKKKGKFQGIQVSFGGTLDETSAEVAANYVLQMTVKAKGKKGKTRLVSIPIRSATYAGGQVTLQPAKKPKPGKYQIQVLSTPLGGLRDTAGAMLINGGATFSLKV